MPDFRTPDYFLWRSCERFGILPPNVKRIWEDNAEWIKACLLGYEQVREMETEIKEHERMALFFKAIASR